ncbi:hypothetical protein, partial [Flavonifractor plautii]|uniref:hypothetical protein n=1 Tax=Flavonifractor plautii TaxID=292800 RepID=UPI003D7E058D
CRERKLWEEGEQVFNPAQGDPLSCKVYFHPASAYLACDFLSAPEDLDYLIKVRLIRVGADLCRKERPQEDG